MNKNSQSLKKPDCVIWKQDCSLWEQVAQNISEEAKNCLIELQQRRLEMVNQIDGSAERLSIDLRSSGSDADTVEALANKHREDFQKFRIGPIEQQIQIIEKLQRDLTVPMAKVL